MEKRNIIITGGAGFIGSHVVRLFVNKYPQYKIINLDKLTYAGNLENLKDIEDKSNYKFVKMDICDFEGQAMISARQLQAILPLQHAGRRILIQSTLTPTAETVAI